MELISDGNITLMRAVEGFDIHRGHRFSTYATLALMKGFARSVPQMLASGRGSGGDPMLLAELADARGSMVADRFAHRDHVHQLLSRLEPRERDVLRATTAWPTTKAPRPTNRWANGSASQNSASARSNKSPSPSSAPPRKLANLGRFSASSKENPEVFPPGSWRQLRDTAILAMRTALNVHQFSLGTFTV